MDAMTELMEKLINNAELTIQDPTNTDLPLSDWAGWIKHLINYMPHVAANPSDQLDLMVTKVTEEEWYKTAACRPSPTGKAPPKGAGAAMDVEAIEEPMAQPTVPVPGLVDASITDGQGGITGKARRQQKGKDKAEDKKRGLGIGREPFVPEGTFKAGTDQGIGNQKVPTSPPKRAKAGEQTTITSMLQTGSK